MARIAVALDQRTHLALAEHLVDELQVRGRQSQQVDAAVTAVAACVVEGRQGLAQSAVRLLSRGDLLGLGKNRRAEGLHALGHRHVLEALVLLGLAARADAYAHDRYRKVFHEVLP